MRPVLPGDVSAAARAVLAVPDPLRRDLALRLVDEASAADRYCKEHRKAHPRWGNGTLLSAAHRHEMRREAGYGDPEFLECQLRVFEALLARSQPEAQDMQRIAVGSSSRRRVAMTSPQSSQ